jgi:DNA-binding NarL/FixJ family response regulator
MFPKDIVQSLPETSRPNVWSLRPDVPAPLPAKVKAKPKPKKDSTPPEVIRSQVLQLTLEGKSMREIAKVINRTASQVWRHQTALRKEGTLPVLSKPDNSPTKAE